MKKIASMFFAVSAIILVSGCSSGSDSTPAPSTLTGTAATGAPINGTVFVKDAKGVQKSIATGTNGSFTLDVAGMTPTYLLKVVPSNGAATLYSYATQNGQTVNLTPTTNLAMLLASNNADLGAVYSNWNGSAISETAVKAAEGTVRANLAAEFTAAGLNIASIDLFTTAFTADSTGIDGVMDNLTIAVDFVAGTYTFADTNGTTFDESAMPPAPAGAISIVTVSGVTHALNGTYSSACYGWSDGRIDSITMTGTAWVNSAALYAGDATCSGSPSSVSAITATVTKGADKQISGWRGQGSTIPTRGDGNGLLSATETVTTFTINITNVSDPGNAAFGGGIPLGVYPKDIFYVFDDSGTGYTMYRDDDGSFASASDPFVSAGSGSGSTGGSGSQLILPVIATSGNEFEMSNKYWDSGCYTINNSIDVVEYMAQFNDGSQEVMQVKTERFLSSDGTCSGIPESTTTNYGIAIGGIDSISGWQDTFGSTVSAPQKQDGTGALSGTESYSTITGTITFTNDASFAVGDVRSLGYVIDDSSAAPVLYRTKGINGEQTPLYIRP